MRVVVTDCSVLVSGRRGQGSLLADHTVRAHAEAVNLCLKIILSKKRIEVLVRTIPFGIFMVGTATPPLDLLQ